MKLTIIKPIFHWNIPDTKHIPSAQLGLLLGQGGSRWVRGTSLWVRRTSRWVGGTSLWVCKGFWIPTCKFSRELGGPQREWFHIAVEYRL